MNYIILFKLTAQGHQKIQEAPKRIIQAKKIFRDLGAEVNDFYVVMGQYDTVFIAQAPDDKTIARCVLALRSLGNVYSETLCAFTEEELKEMCLEWPDLSKYKTE